MDPQCSATISFENPNVTSNFQLPCDSNGSYVTKQNLTVEMEVIYECPGTCNDANETSLTIPGYAGAYVAVINCCIFLTGIVGNVLAIVVVARSQHMRTRFNFYLVNLSLADLCILLICQPVAIVEFFNKDLWPFGEFVCKLVPVLEHTALQTSIMTISLINFERSNAICRPLSVFKGSGRHRAKLTIPLTWLVSIFLSLPFVGIAEVKQVTFLNGADGPACVSLIDQTWKQVFVAANFLLLFFVPVLFMTILLMKIIQKLRSSNIFRGLYEPSCRSSLTSIFSRPDTFLRDGSFQGRLSLINRSRSDYGNFENEIASNMIEEEREDSLSFLPDSLNTGGDSQMLPHLTERVQGYHEALPKTNSWTYEPWSRLPNLIEDDKEDCTDYVEGPNEDNSPLKYCSDQDTFGMMSTKSNRQIGMSKSMYVDDTHGRELMTGRNFGGRASLRGTDMVRNSNGSTVYDSDSNQYRRNSLGKLEERRLSFFLQSRRWPRASQNRSRLSCLSACTTTSHGSQIKILIAIFIFFIFSNTPVRVFVLFQVFAPSSYLGSMNLETYFSIFWTLRIIMYLHSAVNPLVYFLMSSKFSEALKTLLQPKARREKNVILSLPFTQLKLLGIDPMEKTNLA